MLDIKLTKEKVDKVHELNIMWRELVDKDEGKWFEIEFMKWQIKSSQSILNRWNEESETIKLHAWEDQHLIFFIQSL